MVHPGVLQQQRAALVDNHLPAQVAALHLRRAALLHAHSAVLCAALLTLMFVISTPSPYTFTADSRSPCRRISGFSPPASPTTFSPFVSSCSFSPLGVSQVAEQRLPDRVDAENFGEEQAQRVLPLRALDRHRLRAASTTAASSARFRAPTALIWSMSARTLPAIA